MPQPIEGGAAAPNAGAPAPDADAAYAAALDTAMNAATPQARAKAVDALEVLAKQRSGDGGASADPDAPAEGLEGPSSPLAYTLEQALPPGVELVDQPGLGALKGNLHALGVPPEIASGAFTEIATLHSAGVFQSDAAYDQQMAMCKSAIAKVHGEGAKAVLRDAAAYIDKAVAAGKLTPDQADAICASPLAVSHAAMLARHGGRK
ncbi:MAG: hypothetical protein U9R07_14060 [Pseudomonadota bacterium]|nr:hypothetical protein [Pseudomonadota bacterium]